MSRIFFVNVDSDRGFFALVAARQWHARLFLLVLLLHAQCLFRGRQAHYALHRGRCDQKDSYRLYYTGAVLGPRCRARCATTDFWSRQCSTLRSDDFGCGWSASRAGQVEGVHGTHVGC